MTKSGTRRISLGDLPSFLVFKLNTPVQRRIGELYTAEGLPPRAHMLLIVLDAEDGLTQGEISKRLQLDPSDTVGLLDQLELGHHVSRRRDPDDRRRNLVSITATGRRLLRRLDKAMAQADAELLAPLSKSEAATLHTLLAKLYEHHLPTDR